MTQTQTELPQENLPVDLTIHRFPLALLEEFAEKIVVPYFGGNMNRAIQSLMEKSVLEETIAAKATDKR
jgi:hypothetical protein